MSTPESHIIELLQKQEKEAISILYDQYAATLHGIVLRIVHSKEIAEDVVQEAFVKAWRNGATYDRKKGTLFTWLLNITRNTAIDKTRTAAFQHRCKSQSVDSTLYDMPKLTIDPKPEHIGLDKIVKDLEEKHRIIIDLIYFQGYTHAEVTEYLDIPLGTVKTRLRIALRELRKYFGEQKVFFWIIMIGNWFFNG